MGSNRITPSTVIPYRCGYPAPERKWEETIPGQWASRPWLPGEKAEYEREVLGHQE
jgi:hypothetical protein